jgi:spoIIIJ-associated protein
MDTAKLTTLINDFLRQMTVVVTSLDVADDPLTKRVRVHITTPDSRLLIGVNGEHLQALNRVLQHIAEKQSTTERESTDKVPFFFVDVNNYHNKQREELLQKAKIIADRAKLFRHEGEMGNLSSYERMLIHAHFSDDPQIVTESEGYGGERKLMIKYCGGE